VFSCTYGQEYYEVNRRKDGWGTSNKTHKLGSRRETKEARRTGLREGWGLTVRGGVFWQQAVRNQGVIWIVETGCPCVQGTQKMS
jgi:hypothetical protein